MIGGEVVKKLRVLLAIQGNETENSNLQQVNQLITLLLTDPKVILTVVGKVDDKMIGDHVNFVSLEKYNVETIKDYILHHENSNPSNVIILYGNNLIEQCTYYDYAFKTIPYLKNVNIELFRKVEGAFPYFFVDDGIKLKLSKHINFDKKFMTLPSTLWIKNEEKGSFFKEQKSFSINDYLIVNYNPHFKNKKYHVVIDFFETNPNKFAKQFKKIEKQLYRTQSQVTWEIIVNDNIQFKFNIKSNIKFTNRNNQFANEADLYIQYAPDITQDHNIEDIKRNLLQYITSGTPALLFRHPHNIELFGEHYPLFINHPRELVNKVHKLIDDDLFYHECASQAYDVSLSYNAIEVRNHLLSTLWKFNSERETILFAGHDFKFLRNYINYCKGKNINVLIDQWRGHKTHHVEVSNQLLEQADIIFCEWGLGNIEYYSKNKLKGQKLFVRIHRQELETKNLDRIDYEKIDKVIAVSPYILEEFSRLKNIPREKLTLIPNYINVNQFKLNKVEDSKYHLGILGILPKLKRFDLAIDLFEQLWQIDSRYKLFVKGKMPHDLQWLKNRKEEIEFYDEIFARINEAPWKDNIIFDKHDDDVAEWFQNIGFILSTSDIESFHLAAIEGMASGAYPIIFNWPGSKYIYPKEVIVNDVNEARELILRINEDNRLDYNFEQFVSKYDQKLIFDRLDRLIFK